MKPFRSTVEQGAGFGPLLSRRAWTSVVVTHVPKLLIAACEGMSQSKNVAPKVVISAMAFSITARRAGLRPKFTVQYGFFGTAMTAPFSAPFLRNFV